MDWHIEGEIIDRNAPVVEVPETYLESMKGNLTREAEHLKDKKESKIRELKLKKLGDRQEERPTIRLV